MQPQRRKLKVPETSVFEAVVTGAKTAIAAAVTAAIPDPVLGSVLSGSFAEAFGYVGQQIISKRQTAFAEDVVRDLERLHVEVDNLRDSFWTTLLNAVEIARRTHDQEKRAALRNAVVNAASVTAPEDDLQEHFLNIIADLTPLHIRLLQFFAHPESFGMKVEDFHQLHAVNPRNPQAGWDAIEKYALPARRRDLTQMCLNDLINCGLLEYRTDPGPLRWSMLPWPANIAWDFINFITKQDQS